MSIDILIGGLFIAFVAILAVFTIRKAKESKILGVHFVGGIYQIVVLVVMMSTMLLYIGCIRSANRMQKVLDESKKIGVQAFLDYEKDTVTEIVDEAKFLEEKTELYSQKKIDSLSKGKLYGCGVIALFLSICFTIIIVTEQGGYYLATMTPKKLLAVVKDDKILVYNKEFREKVLFKLKKTEENEKKMECFYDNSEPEADSEESISAQDEASEEIATEKIIADDDRYNQNV